MDYPFNTGRTHSLSPLIKWAGGKEKELPHIVPAAPAFNRYFEPFVGGGAVYTTFDAPACFINDRSEELIALYRAIQTQNDAFFAWLCLIGRAWDAMLSQAEMAGSFVSFYERLRSENFSEKDVAPFVSSQLTGDDSGPTSALPEAFAWHRGFLRTELHKTLTRKLIRMRQIESTKALMPQTDILKNIETAYMGALYMYFRRLYNDDDLRRDDDGLSTALFVFIRNYAYSGMFRYNEKGKFNVPYGGLAYNHKRLDKKIAYYHSPALRAHMEKTVVECLDFEDFLHKYPPRTDDFVFLDPPYDSEFSTYARNEFTREDQQRLASYLLHECPARWMLVIKQTPFIQSLYDHPGIRIQTFKKQYLVSFMNRNNKRAEHLLITNY